MLASGWHSSPSVHTGAPWRPLSCLSDTCPQRWMSLQCPAKPLGFCQGWHFLFYFCSTSGNLGNIWLPSVPTWMQGHCDIYQDRPLTLHREAASKIHLILGFIMRNTVGSPYPWVLHPQMPSCIENTEKKLHLKWKCTELFLITVLSTINNWDDWKDRALMPKRMCMVTCKCDDILYEGPEHPCSVVSMRGPGFNLPQKLSDNS